MIIEIISDKFKRIIQQIEKQPVGADKVQTVCKLTGYFRKSRKYYQIKKNNCKSYDENSADSTCKSVAFLEGFYS